MTILRDLLEARTARVFDLDSDGRTLIGGDETGSIQLYEIAADGIIVQLTDIAETCYGRYLPGERTVVVEHDSGGDERGQLFLIRLTDDPDGGGTEVGPLVPLVTDDRYVHHLADTLPGRVVYTTNRRDGVDFDVVVREMAGGAERVVYDGGGYVQTVVVSPDERYVLLVRPGLPARSDQLVLVDTDTGGYEELTPATAEAVYDRLRWLPDSSGFLVTTNADREYTGVAEYHLADRSWRYLATDDEHDLTGWPSPDGRRLLVVTHDDGTHRLGLHDAESGYRMGAIDMPGDGMVTALGDPVWAPDGQRLAFTFTSATEPGDVHLWSGGAWTRQITESSPDLDRSGLVEPESHRIPTPDGELVPCFLYRTADADGSVVLLIHGGPAAASERGWNPMIAALVAQGHAVAVPNVRGSTGYGKRWYTLDDVRRRPDAVADLAAIHDWLPSVGLDPDRAALYGGSYGGYMVLAGLATQPERWAAGVDIVGISSFVTFLENTADYRRSHREREYGSLARDRDFLVEISPLTRVDAIRAPLLILHGARDPRVPVSEAEQLERALTERGVPCELVVYPDEGHGFKKRHNQLDAYPRAAEFLGRHLGST